MTRHRRNKDEGVSVTVPKVAVLAAVVALILIAAVLVLYDDKGDRNTAKLIGLIVTTIPGLLALGFAERASRDIRNGTVVAKAKQGAKAALEEAGPGIATEGARTAIQEEQVMTRVGPAVTAELAALTELVMTNRGIASHLEQVLPSRPVLTNPPPPPR